MSSEQPVPHFFLVLMAAATLLLGLVVYPVAGELFLLGPLVVSFFLALVRMYQEDFSPDQQRIPVVPGHALRSRTATALGRDAS